MFRFFSILFCLGIYTAAKAGELWPARPELGWILAIPFFGLVIGWQFVYRAFPGALESVWFRMLAWVGSLSMGFWATFILFSIPLDLARLFTFGWVSNGGRFLLFGASCAVAALGFIEVLRGPRIRRVMAPVSGLPKSLEGLRIAQISDLHVGPTIQGAYVEEVVRRTNEATPDLIVVTGDLADGDANSVERHMSALRGLKARYGVYYVTGNHEYYWGAERLIENARAVGFQPLVNENRVIDVAGSKLLIGGVTDSSAEEFVGSHRSDPGKAFESSSPSDFKILLAHRPDACVEAEKLGFDLQFSGHTHAGQFFPFSLLMPLAHKYYRGLHRHGRMWLYVNPGTGYWGPAHRFGISPEITLLELARETVLG